MSMSQKQYELLGHPPLLAGESLASFLIRVSNSNFYPEPNILTDLVLSDDAERLEDNLRIPESADTFDCLSALTLVNPHNLCLASAHTFADILTPPNYPIKILRLSDNTPVHLLSRSIAQKSLRAESAGQFCPKCLNQSSYHRLIWTPTVTSVCLHHECLLLDRCYECSKQVTVRDIVMAKCSGCGADLKYAKSVQVDEFGLLSQRVIQAWLSGCAPALPENFIPEQLPRVLYRVIEGLRFTAQKLAASGWPGLHTLASQPADPMTSYAAGSSALATYQSYCVYTTAFKGLVNWPTEFYKFLDAQSSWASDGLHRSRIQEDLGSLYTLWLELHWGRHSAFAFVQNAFDEYIAEHYGLVKSVAHLECLRRRPDLAEKFSYLSINQAAETTGVSIVTIQRLINTGKLAVHTVYDDKNYVKDELVNIADLTRLHDHLKCLLNLEEVTQVLGVSKDVVLDMIKIGLFSVEQRAPKGISHWKLRDRGLQDFVSKLKNNTRAGASNELDTKFTTMTLVTASQKLAVVGLNAVSILQRVAEGKLRAYYNPYKSFRFGDLLFDPYDIQACVSEVKCENNWIERSEVNKRSKVKDSILEKWIQAQLLSPVAIHAGVQYFDKDEVERFITECISSGEAARLLQVSVLSVYNWVGRGRLEAVSGPGIDDSQVYQFNKADLLRWYYGKVTFKVAAQILGVSPSTLHNWVEEERILPLEDIGGKQCWFSRQAVMILRERIEMKMNCTEIWHFTGDGYRVEKILPLK